MVKEGAPFCPECRAPQIRVNVPEPDPQNAPATPPFLPGTPGELQPPAEPIPLSSPIRLRDTLGTAIAASIVLIVCWKLLPPALILITIGAGGLAVLLYHRRRPEIHLSGRAGARVGMMTGVVSSVFFFLTMLLAYLPDGGAKFREAIDQWASQQPANDPTRAEVLKWMNSPDAMATVIVGAMIFVAIILIGFSALGGAITARLLHRKEPR